MPSISKISITFLCLFIIRYVSFGQDVITYKVLSIGKYWTTRQFCIDSAKILEQKKLPLKSEYDSLEMELKKY